ncbi:hypothetical protein Tco_0505364 [Tanacetum coccineum]
MQWSANSGSAGHVIHNSLVKQFWQTATAKTLADGTLELKATIDTIVYTITEASIRTITIPPLSQPAPPTPIATTTTASPSPSPSLAHEPMEHTFEQSSTDPQPPTPRQEAITSQLMIRIGNLEKQLKETKQTFRKAILTLVDSVKTLEVALKRKTNRVLFSDFEEEETEAQGRKTHDLDPLVSLVQELVTPSKTVNVSGEEQVEDISPTTQEAAAILTKVQKFKRSKVKSAFEKVNTGGIKVSSGIEEVNAGSLDVNTGIDPVTTDSIRVSVPSPDREEAGLAKAIRLDALEKALEKEEVDKQKEEMENMVRLGKEEMVCGSGSDIHHTPQLALASLNAELHKNMSKIAKAEAEVAGKTAAMKKSSITLAQMKSGKAIALKYKFEKSSAQVDSCRIDVFRRQDHDDDALFEGESSAKRQKTCEKEYDDQETNETSLEFLVEISGKCMKWVPTCADQKRIEVALDNMMRIQCGLVKKTDLEELKSRWVRKVIKKFKLKAQYVVHHRKSLWAKIANIRGQLVERSNPYEVYSDQKIVELIRILHDQGYEQEFTKKIIVKRDDEEHQLRQRQSNSLQKPETPRQAIIATPIPVIPKITEPYLQPNRTNNPTITRNFSRRVIMPLKRTLFPDESKEEKKQKKD